MGRPLPPLLYMSSHFGWLYSEKKNRSALVPLAVPWPGQFMLGYAIGPEALGPIVQAAGLGGVNQCEGRAAIRRRALLVQVDGDARHVRGPTGVDEQACGSSKGRVEA